LTTCLDILSLHPIADALCLASISNSFSIFFSFQERFDSSKSFILTQNGTILYWNNIGTFDGNFFTVSSNTGTTVINNNTANFTRVVSNRYICTNVIRTIILELRTESQSGPIVTTANTVKVDLPFCP
jgi:hypothetical protein